LILYEDEFTRVYDSMGYWILEDKTKLNKPVLRQVQIGSADPPENLEVSGWFGPTGVWVDLTRTDDGRPAAVRWYFPKEFPRDEILRLAQGLSESYKRRLAEAKKILGEWGG